MNLSRCASGVLTAVMLGTIVTATAGFSPAHHVVVPPDGVKWQPAPPILPAGAEISVLEGNPAEKGPVVMRLKFPAEYVVPPHWHSMTERLTVLSGTFYIGSGDKVDRAASQ